MAHKVYADGNIVHVVYSKFESMIERYFITEKLINLCMDTGLRQVLINAQEYNLFLEPVDILVLIRELNLKPSNQQRRLAIVVSEVSIGFHWTRLDLSSLGWDLQYFTDEELALQWLET